MQTEAGKQLFAHPYYPRRRRSVAERRAARLLGGQALAEAQRLSRPRVRPQLYVALLMAGDLSIVLLGGLLAWALQPGPMRLDAAVAATLWLGALSMLVAVRLGRGYALWRMRLLQLSLAHAVVGLGAALLPVLIVQVVLVGRSFDQVAGWLGWWAALSGLGLFGARILLWSRLRLQTRLGLLEHRLVVVGGGPSLAQTLTALRQARAEGYRVCGVFDERSDTRSPDVVAGFHKTGDLNDLVAFVRMAQIDTVILALPQASQTRLIELLAILSVLPVELRSVPGPALTPPAQARRSRIGALELIDLCRPPATGFEAMQKRLFDLVTASVALVLLAPVMVLVAVAVKLESRGPVLFGQIRHGYNNRPIRILKFRSMHVDRCDPTAVKAVRRDDPRVTRVGRFIRRTSLDELPQLLNVLGGSMSMVGPRPHATAARTGDILYDEVADAYWARHKVKPGITGWAQIHGWRGEMNTSEKIRERVAHDLWYAENWSVWLDVKILARTPAALVLPKNAY